MADFMSQVFLTNEVLGMIVKQLSTGGYSTVQGNEFRGKFADIALQVMAKEDI